MGVVRTWAAGFWAYLAWVWEWIAQNQAPVTVLITLAGVLVDWRYVVRTRRLAEAANVQAGASRVGAEAAADQARSTRLIFEAAHRPYLAAGFSDYFLDSVENFQVSFTVKNRGPVPAVVISWQASLKLASGALVERAPEPADAGICIFPEKSADFEFRSSHWGGIVGRLPDGIVVEFTIENRGFHETRYTSSLVCASSGGGLGIAAQSVR